MTGADIQTSSRQDAENDVTGIDNAVTEAGTLDAAADAGVLRAFINVLHGLQRFPDTANALPHDLAGAVCLARIQDIPLTDVVAVYADPLSQYVHHPFHCELRLV